MTVASGQPATHLPATPGPIEAPATLELSIVMPCLNEQETVAICVRKALDALHAAQVSGEVIVADNGSTDASVPLALDAEARVVHVAEKGCGSALRAFRRDSFLRMDLRSTGMEFASEMVVKASLLGMRVSEVPTTLAPDGRSRPPHLRSWRDGWRHLRFLLMYSPRWLFLYPGIALMAIGLAASAWMLPGHRVIGAIAFDIHTQLYAFLAALLGFQLIAFAVFTKVFAISEVLLPPDPRLKRLFRYITLEIGLAVGAVLTLAGLIGSIFAVSHWAEHALEHSTPPTCSASSCRPSSRSPSAYRSSSPASSSASSD